MKLHKISKEGHEKCEIEIIDDKDYFWINRRDLEIESDYKNWAVIFDKCDQKNKNTDVNLYLIQNFNHVEY